MNKKKADDIQQVPKIALWPLRSSFKDPIHKLIPVNTIENTVIQHPIFNRLHGIKQLGFTFYVYPQAKHTRFEHSLGALHLAHLMAEAFKRNSPELTEKLVQKKVSYDYFIQLMRMTGLLHDLGHLPYSHTTEELLTEAYHEGKLSKKMYDLYKKAEKNKLKIHEQITCELIKKLKTHIQKEHKSEQNMISQVFSGVLYALCNDSSAEWKKVYTKDGIKIARNAISGKVTDVDRMDYLIRDAYNTGATYGNIDIERLAQGLKLYQTKNEINIVIPSKIISNVEELYYARYMMYKWVYQHHKVIALELTYKETLKRLAKNWREHRKKLGKLIPNSPANFWDIFHPDNIWKYTVKTNLKIDDIFIESIIRLSSNTKTPSVYEWSRYIANRITPYHPVIKRQEDLLAIIHEYTTKNKIGNITGYHILDTLKLLIHMNEYELEKTMEQLLEQKDINTEQTVLKECARKTTGVKERIECVLGKIIDDKIVGTRRKKKTSIKVYITPPIASQLPEQPYLLSGNTIMPLLQASSIIKAINETGQKPMLYLYYTSEKRDPILEEQIKAGLVETLINLARMLSSPRENV